jgi:hypothetical protein
MPGIHPLIREMNETTASRSPTQKRMDAKIKGDLNFVVYENRHRVQALTLCGWSSTEFQRGEETLQQ